MSKAPKKTTKKTTKRTTKKTTKKNTGRTAKKTTIQKTSSEKITKMCDDISSVGLCRIEQIENNFPELKREDFASDTEYTKALQEQYLALRQQEYEYIVMQQSYDVYLASRCVNDIECRSVMFGSDKTVAENMYIVSDEKEPSKITKNIAASEDFSYKIMQGDSAAVVNNAGIHVDPCGHATNVKTPRTGAAHCAMTGLRIVSGISDRLGYKGKNNFAKNAWAGANAGLIHGRNAGTGRTGCSGAIYDGKYSVAAKGKTLKQLILSGEVGPGTVISTGDDNGSGNPNKVHGYHTLTIASINKDENGNIVSYTLMDNNGGDARTRLEVHDINGSFGREQVLYTKTHEWANDMFKKEMQGKSAEELQQMIIQSKERVCSNVIPDLTRNELTLICDETYLKSSGKTKKGITRAPYLRKQQENFRKFYYEQNEKSMSLGQKKLNDFDNNDKPNNESSEFSANEKKATASVMRMDAKKSCCKYDNILKIIEEYSKSPISFFKAGVNQNIQLPVGKFEME